MEYSFSKSKLPRGESYPLKRSLLDGALQQANVKNLTYVAYLRNQRVHEVMRVDFHGEHLRAAAAGNASVTVYSVPGEQRAATESVLVREGLAAIVKWRRGRKQREALGALLTTVLYCSSPCNRFDRLKRKFAPCLADWNK